MQADVHFRTDRGLYLTPIEYKRLCLLHKNTGKVLTHQFIMQNIWGRNREKSDVPAGIYGKAAQEAGAERGFAGVYSDPYRHRLPNGSAWLISAAGCCLNNLRIRKVNG